MITYTVQVNGQQVDAEFPKAAYDYNRLSSAFNQNRKLCKPNYILSNAFNILISNKFCDYNTEK